MADSPSNTQSPASEESSSDPVSKKRPPLGPCRMISCMPKPNYDVNSIQNGTEPNDLSRTRTQTAIKPRDPSSSTENVEAPNTSRTMKLWEYGMRKVLYKKPGSVNAVEMNHDQSWRDGEDKPETILSEADEFGTVQAASGGHNC